MLALFVVHERLQVQLVRIANLIRRYDPRTNRPMSIERLAQRHRGRPALPVADADVVDDHVSRNYLVARSRGT